MGVWQKSPARTSNTCSSRNTSSASNRAASVDGSVGFNWAASARSSESCTCTIFIPLTYHSDISKLLSLGGGLFWGLHHRLCRPSHRHWRTKTHHIHRSWYGCICHKPFPYV